MSLNPKWSWIFCWLSLIFLCQGCGVGSNEQDLPDPIAGATLEIVVYGNPGLAEAIDARLDEWEATRLASVTLRSDSVADPTAIPDADLVIVAAERLGDWVDLGALRPIPDESLEPAATTSLDDEALEDPLEVPGPAEEPFALTKIAAPFRDPLVSYGERMGIPIGGSVLVLVYREAPFENTSLQQEAERLGVALELPETWEDLDQLARFFHGRDWDGDGSPESGISFVGGPDLLEGLGNATFLARASATALHRDYFAILFDSGSMAPRIDTPPFVEALDALRQLADAGPVGLRSFDPEDARQAFRSGDVAFLIDRAEAAARWLEAEDESTVNVIELPGSYRTFDPTRGEWIENPELNRPTYLPVAQSWMVGVSANTTNEAAAVDLAKYLGGSQVGAQLRGDPRATMLSVRAPLIGRGPYNAREIPALDARGWGSAVSKAVNADRFVVGLRIPDAVGYQSDLDAARSQVIGGETTATEALGALAKSWQSRTGELGFERQLWHFRRSLNRFETSTEPPPR